MTSDKSLGVAFLTFLGALVLLPLLWLYGIFAYGFVAIKLWAWFVVPIFHTDITFGIFQAAGLFMFVRFFTTEYKMPVTNPDETTGQKIASAIFLIAVPWTVLLFAWILKSIM